MLWQNRMDDDIRKRATNLRKLAENNASLLREATVLEIVQHNDD